MSWYQRFTNKKRNFGIENLMAYVSVSMVIIFIANYVLQMPIISLLELNMSAVLRGQIWRLITFILIPTTSSFFWILISASFYYFIGKSLEEEWGKSAFTLYYLVGIAGTIIAAFITGYADNTYLNMSLFLAYAFLFPETEFRIYFILPVKAKYLGYIDLGFYLISLGFGIYTGITTGRWYTFGSIIASLANFIVFFGPDFIIKNKRRIENKKRKQEFERSLRKNKDNDFNK